MAPMKDAARRDGARLPEAAYLTKELPAPLAGYTGAFHARA